MATGFGRGEQTFPAGQCWGQPTGALANGCHSEELIRKRKAASYTRSYRRWRRSQQDYTAFNPLAEL